VPVTCNNQTCVIRRSSFTTATATWFYYPVWINGGTGGLNLRFQDCTTNFAGSTFAQLEGSTGVNVLTLQNTNVAATALFVAGTAAGCLQLIDSTATGTIDAAVKVSSQSLVLNGAAELLVSYPAIKATSLVSIATTTAGGTPAPRFDRIVAGTGAYVTGTAGDTSTVQVTIY